MTIFDKNRRLESTFSVHSMKWPSGYSRSTGRNSANRNPVRVEVHMAVEPVRGNRHQDEELWGAYPYPSLSLEDIDTIKLPNTFFRLILRFCQTEIQNTFM